MTNDQLLTEVRNRGKDRLLEIDKLLEKLNAKADQLENQFGADNYADECRQIANEIFQGVPPLISITDAMHTASQFVDWLQQQYNEAREKGLD